MMKKSLLFILLFALLTAGYAQNDTPSQSGEPAESTVEKPVKPEKNYKPLVVRDRLVFDIYHSFWMGTPSQGDFLKFDPGFNVSAMWDFILPQAKSLSFGLGLGFTYYTQYSDCMFKYNRSKDISQYYILPEDLEYKHSRLAYMNVNIPIEIRYRHPCGFKIDVGVHVGLVAGLTYKYKGPHYNGVEDDYLNYKDYDFYNKQKFSADVYIRMGWKAFGVYYSYQLNKVFETGKGPAMNPMSLGISIALF